MKNEMKVYIAIPGSAVSGGAETMHQFAQLLQESGINTYIYIYDQNEQYKYSNVLSNYKVKYIFEIEDNARNYLIVPEVATDKLADYLYIRKCIWWLSLNFYLNRVPDEKTKYVMKKYNLPKILKPMVKAAVLNKIKFSDKVYKFDSEVFHLYNCEYEKQFLLEKGVTEDKMLYLCGPLREEYFEKINLQKENIILYNPSKGKKFTKKIIKSLEKNMEEVRIIPIMNMNPNQIKEIMERSKVYIDLGEFPGPERIPREAVICGCNILTSKLGAAANNIDVPIPDCYKFETKNRNVLRITKKIYSMLDEYESDYMDFDRYRNKVREQLDLFQDNTKIFIQIIKVEIK